MTIAEIEPVNRESTAGIIARQLREAIAKGLLAPGVQVGEAALAAQFAVSRGPLREAMQRLVQEGLLRSERHRGLFVVELVADDVIDIYAARTAVENAAVLAIMNGDRAAVAAQLDVPQREMAAAADRNDPNGVSLADLRFHEVLVEASGSPRLVRMMQTLLIETQMCLHALERTYDDVAARVSEHEEIIQAIRAGDVTEVLTLLEAHMDDALQRLVPAPSAVSAG